MTDTTLRYYNTSFSYRKQIRSRRIDDFKKQLRTRISRRRAKQAVKQVLHKMQLL